MQNMIFYKPDYIPASYFEGWDLWLWIACSVLLLCSSILLTLKARNPQEVVFGVFGGWIHHIITFHYAHRVYYRKIYFYEVSLSILNC